ncbi:MAG: 5-formyltetrahydrofolate cyclo-ligase [Actinomycetota bacterium]
MRERVWEAIASSGAARFPGTRGRIPNFVGAEAAAAALAATPEWAAASVLKVNPDSPQLPVRVRALTEGKLLYMAVPRLRAAHPFFCLDPDRLTVPARKAASIGGSAAAGEPVGLEAMEPIDLIVCGTVAVNREGVRIGKGGGFSDLEFALARQAGLIGDSTVVATTVHPLQVLDEPLPETGHDFRVDLIVTPDGLHRVTRAGGGPPGILWSHLDAEKIAAIPVLAELAKATKTGG